MNGITEQKRASLEERAKKRDSATPSILESLGFDDPNLQQEQQVISNLADADPALSDRPALCPTCVGKGWVKSLFRKWECSACWGTTYDLSNPIAIIKWQKLCMDWAKRDVQRTREALYRATTTEAEREEQSIQEFHGSSKRTD